MGEEHQDGGHILLCYTSSSSIAAGDNDLTIDHTEFVLGRNFYVAGPKGCSDHNINVFDYRKCPGKGGGVSVLIDFRQQMYITISNCVFHSNIANIGTHLFVSSGYGDIVHETDSGEFHNFITPSNHDTNGSGANTGNTFQLIDCSFINGTSKNGGIFFLHKMIAYKIDSLYLHNCTFSHNFATGDGGALLHYTNRDEYEIEPSTTMLLVKISKCNFFNNVAQRGGAVIFRTISAFHNTFQTGMAPITMLINETNFHDNVAMIHGGHIFMECRGKAAVILHCHFQNGTARLKGGGVYLVLPILSQPTETDTKLVVTLYKCIFISNRASSGGGVSLHYKSADIVLIPSRFDESTVSIHERIIQLIQCNFTANEAEHSGGGMSIYTELYEDDFRDMLPWLQVNITICKYAENSAQYGGGIEVKIYSNNIHRLDTVITIVGSQFINNTVNEEGSAIYIVGCANPHNIQCLYCFSHSQLQVYLNGSFMYNNAKTFSSTVSTQGVHLLQISDTHFLSNIGSSIHAKQTKILVKGKNNVFYNNTAITGGAFFLDCHIIVTQASVALYTRDVQCMSRSLLSRIHFSSDARIEISRNVALQYGGGIAINDKCNEEHNWKLCFFEPEDTIQFIPSTKYTIVTMERNKARIAGNSIFGGHLEPCFWNKYKIATGQYFKVLMNMFRLLFEIKNKNLSIRDVTTDPYRICFCEQETITNESYCTMNIDKYVFWGEQFSVLAMAVGTITTLSEEFIRASLSSTVAELEPRQDVQLLARHCSELTYTIRTIENKVNLNLYIDCISIQKHKLISTINVHFLPCPIGFNLSGDPPQCDCAPHIRRELPTLVCDINSQTLQIQNGSWIGNFSENLIGYPHCPFDYCIQQHTLKPSIPDASCAMNRSGVLCGECRDGYSLALGSGHCLQCSNIYLLLLLPIIAAGVLLVLFLKLCNLTVSKGTISGLILYANIIQVKITIFFPQTSSVFTKALIIIIAWLNLDLGIETCFLAGMNEYIKAWLQFAFPVFIWGLVGLVILCSRYSLTLSRLIGGNAVQVLATLFLLSYAKLLRTVFAAVSPIRIVDRYGTSHLLWLMDGNIPFLRWPHIFLFLFAVFATFSYIIPLMLLTALAPYLQARSDRRLLRWVTKMKPLLDAYTGPYRDNHRYWTGFMLLLRIILFTTFAANATGDPVVDLLAVVIVMACVLLWQRFAGRIYMSYCNSLLEAFYLINLDIFTAVTLLMKEIQASPETQEYIACAFVGAALIAFPFTTLWKFQYRGKIWQQLKNIISRMMSYFFKDKTISTTSKINTTVSEVELMQMCASPIVSSQLREPLLDDSYLQ